MRSQLLAQDCAVEPHWPQFSGWVSRLTHAQTRDGKSPCSSTEECVEGSPEFVGEEHDGIGVTDRGERLQQRLDLIYNISRAGGERPLVRLVPLVQAERQEHTKAHNQGG